MYQSKHKGKKIDSAIDKVPVLEEELNQTVSRVQNMENGIADNKSRINEIEVSKGQPNGYASLNSEGNIFLEQIADGAITTSKIGKNAVDTDNIKDAAVDSAKILNGSIAARHIMNGEVTRDKIATDSISSDKIANKSVITEKINDGAVTTEKIKDGAVNSDKLAKKISVEEVNVSERVMAYCDCGDETTGEEMYEYVNLFHDGNQAGGNYGIQFGNPSDFPQGSITHNKGYYIPENSGQSTFITLNGSEPGKATDGTVLSDDKLEINDIDYPAGITTSISATGKKILITETTSPDANDVNSENSVTISAKEICIDNKTLHEGEYAYGSCIKAYIDKNGAAHINLNGNTNIVDIDDGNIVAQGSVTAGDGELSAGNGIRARSGNIVAEQGNIEVPFGDVTVGAHDPIYTKVTDSKFISHQDVPESNRKLQADYDDVVLTHVDESYDDVGNQTITTTVHKLTEKANMSDLNSDNIKSVYSSKLKPSKLVNKPGISKMTGDGFAADIAGVIDVGGAYVPQFAIDYVWERQHQNITSTTYFVNYDTGSSSATGLSSSAALKYPSDAMKKAKNGDMIVIMGGYYPRNQLGFDQNKSVHIQGGIFCNADNNRSLTWTLVEGTTYKTTRSQAFAVWQAIKDGSEFSELLPTPTLALCKSTNGAYFIDGDTVYVNTPSGYSGAPGYDILVSLNAVGATINTNVWCEDTVFVFGGQAACLNRSNTNPALFSGCTFKYAKQNGFMSQGGKSYLLNCKAYNNGRDGFSYKKLNSNVSYGFEVGCTAHHNGDDESTGSDNGSTAHEGSIVTRINGKYYENKGPNIADVNPGTISYNLNCACSNSSATAQDRQIDFNIEDGTMYLDRCTSDGSFISLYEASVTMPQTTKSYNLGSVLPGVYRVKNVNGVAENLSGGEDIANKVTSISSSSTHVQYPSAKAVNDALKAQKNDVAAQFANALKGKVSGENAVRIDDSSPIEHEMNVRVSSKNLIDLSLIPTEETVKYGITYKYLPDEQCILLNGTATVGDIAIMKEIAQRGDKMPAGIDYTYSLRKISGTISEAVALEMAKDVKTPAYLTFETFLHVNASNTSKTAKNTATFSVGTFYLYIPVAGTVFDNCKIQIQLERGTTVTDYTPYVDPASVILTRRGKNLLPYTYASYNSAGAPNTLTNNGITYTLQSDKSVIANGTVTDKQSQFFYSDAAGFKLPNYNIYTLSANNNGSQNTYYNRMEFVATDGSGNYAQNVTTKPLSLTQGQAKRPNSGTYCKFYAYENAKLNNVTLYPQIELGDTYTGYEPVLPAITLTPSADGTVTGVNNIYPTTTLLANKDNVVIDVEYNRDLNNPDVFKDYVKFTDYARVNKSGVVSLRDVPSCGLAMDIQNYLKIVRSSNEDIDAKTNLFKPIVPANLDYAVRSVNPKVNTALGDSIIKNCIYDLGEQTSLSITLPATGNVGDWLQFDFMSGTTATTLAIASTAGILGYDLIPEINTIYSLYLDWGIIGKSNTSSTYGWRFSYSEYPING